MTRSLSQADQRAAIARVLAEHDVLPLADLRMTRVAERLRDGVVEQDRRALWVAGWLEDEGLIDDTDPWAIEVGLAVMRAVGRA